MKRQRGRGRKGNGQANRHYESNGPDIKIRGSASHIHEKYQQLARDASSSGDRIMAENYLQHAEHYYRIVQSFQKVARERAEDGRDFAEEPAPEAAEAVESSPLEVVTPEASDIVEEQPAAEQPTERRPRRQRRPRNNASNGAEAPEVLETAAGGES
ncbi:MAG: DUF4167 domain-containing protein [Caulobacterales bacterium]|nr:DUF4167 domain-containing protein [Caulobacterales bacterium]